jgi:hypothetical protein
VHPAVHAVLAEHSVMAAVSCSEYRAQDDEPGQCEGPKAKVPAHSSERAFGTIGQKENEIAGDCQRRCRDQRYEVDHCSPLIMFYA